MNDNARELELFAVNTATIVTNQLEPVYRNLERKMKRGIYDRELAIKGLLYPVEQAAKLYVKEYCGRGTRWHDIFSVADRKEAAISLRDSFEAEVSSGNGWLERENS